MGAEGRGWGRLLYGGGFETDSDSEGETEAEGRFRRVRGARPRRSPRPIGFGFGGSLSAFRGCQRARPPEGVNRRFAPRLRRPSPGLRALPMGRVSSRVRAKTKENAQWHSK